MMKLRGIGFFRELSKTPSDRPSLRDALSDVAQLDEDKIVDYLKRGAGLAAWGGYVTDVLDPSITGLAVSTRTDGVYAWRSDLAYYVEKYHVRIPADFVAHMRANNWMPPDEDSIEVDDFVIE